MSFAMTRAEREAFLAETRVGILGVVEPRRGPLTVPVWYQSRARSCGWSPVRRPSRDGCCARPGA